MSGEKSEPRNDVSIKDTSDQFVPLNFTDSPNKMQGFMSLVKPEPKTVKVIDDGDLMRFSLLCNIKGEKNHQCEASLSSAIKF